MKFVADKGGVVNISMVIVIDYAISSSWTTIGAQSGIEPRTF